MSQVQLKSTGKCHPKETCLYGIGRNDKAVIHLHPQQQWTYMQITNKETDTTHINVKRGCLVVHLGLFEFNELFTLN